MEKYSDEILRHMNRDLSVLDSILYDSVHLSILWSKHKSRNRTESKNEKKNSPVSSSISCSCLSFDIWHKWRQDVAWTLLSVTPALIYERATMMKELIFLAVCFFNACFSVPLSRPTNWLRQCRASTNISITALEVLPGGGWDNLRNMDMGRVMNLSYFQCQTTEDGLYLIPDEVFVIPQKETGVETSSEILSSWLDQKSSTSHTINSDISFLTVLNAKFSSESMRMKTHQVKDSSTTARVQVSFFCSI